MLCVLCLFLLCDLVVRFIVSETSLTEWLFCCIPIFCFWILFMFLLSFGRENFVDFTLSFLFLFLFGFFLGGLDCWGTV